VIVAMVVIVIVIITVMNTMALKLLGISYNDNVWFLTVAAIRLQRDAFTMSVAIPVICCDFTAASLISDLFVSLESLIVQILLLT
jgi:hypothetical protein